MKKLLILTLLILCKYNFAKAEDSAVANENKITNQAILNEIEKSFLFSDEQEDFAVENNKKSKINIGKDRKIEKNPLIQSSLNKKKYVNKDARTKEKLAYNAALSGQYEVAIELYKQIIEQEPANVYAQTSLAILYQRINQLKDAKRIYYSILKQNPQNKEEIINNLLTIMNIESPKEAQYLLERLILQYPDSAYLLAQASITYCTNEHYQEAIEYMTKAIKITDRLDYKYNLAIIYDKSGNAEKAFETYSEVIKSYKADDKFSSQIPLIEIQKRIETLKN